MKRYINRLMARLGYVPVAQVNNLRAAIDELAKSTDIKAASVPLKIEVDDSQVRETLVLLEQVTSAAAAAEVALAQLREAAPAAAEAWAAANPIAAELRKINEFLEWPRRRGNAGLPMFG